MEVLGCVTVIKLRPVCSPVILENSCWGFKRKSLLFNEGNQSGKLVISNDPVSLCVGGKGVIEFGSFFLFIIILF